MMVFQKGSSVYYLCVVKGCVFAMHNCDNNHLIVCLFVFPLDCSEQVEKFIFIFGLFDYFMLN